MKSFSIQFGARNVDREAGVIHGCAVASIGEARGHDLWIDGKTLGELKDAAEYYRNGVKVKVDHKSGVMATIGYLRGFQIDGDVLRADLHVLKTAGDREKLFEMAETIPDTFGLSVSFTGKDETKDGKTFARCDRKGGLLSVDIVTEAAANPQGLFSAIHCDEVCRELGAILESITHLSALIAVDKTNCNHEAQKIETETTMDEDTKKALEAITKGIADLSANVTEQTKSLSDRIAKLEQLSVPEKKPEDVPAEAKPDAEEVCMSAIGKNVTELSAKIEAMSVVISRLGGTGAAASPAGDKPAEVKTFKAAVEAIMLETKCDKPAAVRAAIVKYPELHKEFVQAGGRDL